MKKKEIKRHPAANAIADYIFNNYEIKNVRDITDAVKDLFGPLFEKILDAEMEHIWAMRSHHQSLKKH